MVKEDMYLQIIGKAKPEFEKALEFFKLRIAKIRTGRASPSLVEDIMVDAYDQKMPIKQLAAISCPEPKQILIQPWDPSMIGFIEKAISAASLGSSPVVDKDCVRVILPLLTQEFREKLLKILSGSVEETREMLRKARDEVWSQIQEAQRGGQIREDEKFKGKDELQRLVGEYQSKIDELVARKQKEIQI